MSAAGVSGTGRTDPIGFDTDDVALCLEAGVALLHGNEDSGPAAASGRPASTPIVQSSLFTWPDFDSLLTALAAEHRHHVYTRGRNPTVQVLEERLARLERGEACTAFASGMGAISAVLLGLLQAGDHVLFVNNIYGPTLQLAEQLRRFGIDHTVVLDVEPDAVAAALRPETRLLWLESPGTMTFRVADVAAIAAAAKARGVTTCVDNSWATPLLQKPLVRGADLVVHSASKYLSGHSDVMAGAVIGRQSMLEQIFYRAFMLHGAQLSPHDAWLVLRGLRTLPLRLERQGRDALAVATHLRSHPAVRSVHHPALTEAAPAAAAQLAGCSGLFSFVLRRDGFAAVKRVIDALRVFRIGVSWGGPESLVISPNRGDNEAALDAQRIPRSLIRLSIGLEGADALIADLDRALETVA